MQQPRKPPPLLQVIKVFFIRVGFFFEGDVAISLCEQFKKIDEIEGNHKQFKLLHQVNPLVIDQDVGSLFAAIQENEGEQRHGRRLVVQQAHPDPDSFYSHRYVLPRRHKHFRNRLSIHVLSNSFLTLCYSSKVVFLIRLFFSDEKFDKFTVRLIFFPGPQTPINPNEKMNRASSSELHLHYSLMENGGRVLPQLFETFGPHLLSCLLRWYKHYLHADPTLAQEAVYQSLKQYAEHPRTFNPEQGSLEKFLEIAADRYMQAIFEREKCQLRSSSVKHLLAKYFDNERDISLAKMLLKNEASIFSYISLLDIGSYPFMHQQTEIRRETMRIRKALEHYQLYPIAQPKKRTAKTAHTSGTAYLS